MTFWTFWCNVIKRFLVCLWMQPLSWSINSFGCLAINLAINEHFLCKTYFHKFSIRWIFKSAAYPFRIEKKKGNACLKIDEKILLLRFSWNKTPVNKVGLLFYESRLHMRESVVWKNSFYFFRWTSISQNIFKKEIL